MRTETAPLGTLTIPGQPKHLHEARAFVARTLGPGCLRADEAVLLASELIGNAMQYSDSRRDGGTIIMNVIAIPGGVRIEVIDEGGPTLPNLSPIGHPQPDLAESGRGLQLVSMLSSRWAYSHDPGRTVTWCELDTSPSEQPADGQPLVQEVQD